MAVATVCALIVPFIFGFNECAMGKQSYYFDSSLIGEWTSEDYASGKIEISINDTYNMHFQVNGNSAVYRIDRIDGKVYVLSSEYATAKFNLYFDSEEINTFLNGTAISRSTTDI